MAMVFLPIVHRVLKTCNQRHAACVQGFFHGLRIRGQPVVRGHHVQPFAGVKPHLVLAVGAHAAQLCGMFPPFFLQVLCLHHAEPWLGMPCRVGKAGILVV